MSFRTGLPCAKSFSLYGEGKSFAKRAVMRKIIEGLRLFFSGAFDLKKKSVALLSDQYENELEEFFILCFSDMLGIDMPTSYYALEFYPFLVEEVEKWQKKSNDRKSVWEHKAQTIGVDP